MRKLFLLSLILTAMFLMFSACGSSATVVGDNEEQVITGTAPEDTSDMMPEKLSELYLAGGCFWGVESYMSQINGVYDVTSGYANGEGEDPSYQDVIKGDRGFVEAVHVQYDPMQVTLQKLLTDFFRVIDPTSENKQGNDVGIQYRTGIYYTDEEDLKIIQTAVSNETEKYNKDIVTEVLPLENYYLAEEYHQDYLVKNPNGYCHIDMGLLEEQEIEIISSNYPRPTDEELKQRLSEIQYKVAVMNATESAFSNKYWDHYEPGIYIDIATGEPLFSSSDKYHSNTGWPSFTKPIISEVIIYHQDSSSGRKSVV